MRTVNNHKHLLIGKQAPASVAGVTRISNALTSTATAAQLATPANIADGEIALVREDGAILGLGGTAGLATNTVSLKKLYMVQGQGPALPLIKTSLIYKDNKKFIKGKRYTVGVQQVSYIGYNAILDAGTIDALPNNDYIVRTNLKSNFSEFADKAIILLGSYSSGTSTTAEQVAYELTKNLIANTERQVNIPYLVERVTQDAAPTITTVALVTQKGSKTVTTTSTADFVVGDYIRFGNGNDNAIYKVTSLVTNTSYTLDIAYQGVDATFAIGAAEKVVPVFYGIRLTGLPVKFKEGVFRYQKSKWLTSIQNGGATQVADQTIASEGSGIYEQIAEDEWFYQLQEGFADSIVIQIPPVTFRKNVASTSSFTSTAGYAQIETQWSYSEGTDIINNPTAWLQVKFAIFDANSGAARANQLDVISDDLETWTGDTLPA